MASKKQKACLSDLLDGIEKAHRAEILLYTSGHLNLNKIYKTKETIKHNYWESAKKSALFYRRRMPCKELSRKTSIPFAHISDATTPNSSPVSIPAKTDSRLSYQTSGSSPTLGSSVSPSFSEGAFQSFTTSRWQKKVTEEEAQKPRIREELDVPGMKTLKYKPTQNSRLCVMGPTKDEYQFIPSYLAGITKADQYHSFMQFQKNVIAQKDLLENDYIGSKTAEHHEKKLTQALQNICDCHRPHFNRMQAVGHVFEDICNSSLIFGDILKEVKNEYELYMMILLDSLPTMQYRMLQKEVKGMQKRALKTHEIEEARREIHLLVQKSKSALERNEELRNELEIEMYLSQSASEPVEEESPDTIKEEAPLSSVDQLASLRCKAIIKFKEIKAMEKEIKDTMVFAGITHIKEKTIKELEGESVKLKASNKFLKRQIADVVLTITTTINRQKLPLENLRLLWSLVKDFLVPNGDEDLLEDLEVAFFQL